MATFTGHDGKIEFTGGGQTDLAIANMRNFTIEQTQETIEDTVMSTGNMTRTYKPGLSTFTMSADIFWDGSNTGHLLLDDFLNQEGGDTLVSFKAYPSGDATGGVNAELAGSGILTSLSITSSVDGMVEASVAIQGSGALTTTNIS
jgi:predicted secreted protein